MALQNIEANITLDLYNHDTTPSTVKAISLTARHDMWPQDFRTWVHSTMWILGLRFSSP